MQCKPVAIAIEGTQFEEHVNNWNRCNFHIPILQKYTNARAREINVCIYRIQWDAFFCASGIEVIGLVEITTVAILENKEEKRETKEKKNLGLQLYTYVDILLIECASMDITYVAYTHARIKSTRCLHVYIIRTYVCVHTHICELLLRCYRIGLDTHTTDL
jgi:hypothetical protein